VHSLFGNIAKCIRLWAGERDFGEELAPLQPSRQVRNPNDIGLPELQEVELLAKERDQKDFTAYINALGVSWVVWPEDSLRWKADEWRGNSKYKAVARTFESIDRINEIAEAKERFDITSMEWEPTATDGSTWAGMWTMFHIAEPQEDLSVEEQVADAYCTYECSDRAECCNLVSLGGSFPKKFGTIAISSKDTEQFAMTTDMIFRLQENAGPVFTDSEMTKIRSSQDISELSARDRCKMGSEHLYNLLDFIQHLLRKKWLESPADEVQVERVRAELEQWKGKNKIPGAVMAPAPNAYVIAKIKSHIKIARENGRYNQPCYIGHVMNVYVDKQVNERNSDIQGGRRLRPDTIMCNPFPSYLEFKYEGKSVLQSPAKFVKELAGILTMNHIGDAKARPERGRAARMQKLFYPAAWKINALYEEEDDRIDQTVHRLNLRLYSWTHFIRMGRISKKGAMQAYLLKFEDLALAGEDGTNPKPISSSNALSAWKQE
jgi:hypothetical protein